jgi:hypothetical protein
MPAQKAAPPTVAAVLGARGKASIPDRSSPIAKPSSRPQQAALLRAELIGDTAGITTCSYSSCKKLLSPEPTDTPQRRRGRPRKLPTNESAP